VKLRHLDAWTEARRSIAARYNEGFASSDGIQRPVEEGGCYNVYHQYTIGVGERDALQERLRGEGIATAVYYPLPLHLQPAYAMLGGKEGDMPFAEAAAKSVLSLPVSPDMPESDQNRVIAAVRELALTLSAA